MKWLFVFLLLTFSNSYAGDLECLTENIYHEARGEGRQGWVAVGVVTLNRVKSPLFPDDVCSVVKQRKQFSWTENKNIDIKNKQLYSRIKNIAHLLLNNEVVSPVGDALYYHADRLYGKTEKFEPYWAKHKVKIAQVGRHIFYRRK